MFTTNEWGPFIPDGQVYKAATIAANIVQRGCGNNGPSPGRCDESSVRKVSGGGGGEEWKREKRTEAFGRF